MNRDALLKHVPFRRFWLGETASSFAYQMLVIAVGWQMYRASPAARWSLGLIGLVQFFSLLLFALPAGHVADRYDRLRIALVCQLVQCALAVILARAGAHAG